jgi:hypothetical protein
MSRQEPYGPTGDSAQRHGQRADASQQAYLRLVVQERKRARESHCDHPQNQTAPHLNQKCGVDEGGIIPSAMLHNVHPNSKVREHVETRQENVHEGD